MAQRRGFVVAALLVALVVAGCGGSPLVAVSPGAAGGKVTSGDACSLITADEVWAIMNSDRLVAFQDPESPTRCVYVTQEGSAHVGAATVTWEPTGGEAKFKPLRGDSSFEVVAGIGEEAYRYGDTLLFRIGDQSFEVLPQWSGNAERRAQAVAMATIMAARVTGQAVPVGAIPTPPPVLSTKDPCKLVSNDEAAAALGTGPLTSYNNDTGSSNQPIFCFYSLADGTAVLTTFLDPKGGFDQFDQLVATVTGEPVEGIGDKAVFEAFQGRLYVLKGDTIFTVNAFTSAPESALAADRKIMEIILSHI